MRRYLYERKSAFVTARAFRLRGDSAEVAPRELLRLPRLP